MIEIHAYHGWGFDASFWDNLTEKPPQSLLFKTADRGYFGKSVYPEFESDTATKVLFVHSFGLHWVNTNILSQADILVVFNGFEEFVSSEPLERRRELKILNRMAAQFEKQPTDVLHAFYANCFHPTKNKIPVPDEFNEPLLLNDLKALATAKINSEEINTQVVVLSGAEDLIVPHKRSADLAHKLNAQHFEIIENAGHALPIVNSSESWSFLSRVVPIFGQHAERNESQ